MACRETGAAVTGRNGEILKGPRFENNKSEMGKPALKDRKSKFASVLLWLK